MDLISVSCNQCAAPLEVSSSSRFVTCSFCQSRLEIHRSESAVFTAVLDELKQKTDTIGRDVSVIRKQNELAQLDREWEAVKSQSPNHRHTSSLASILLALPVLVVFTMLGIMFLRINPLFGVLWLSLVVFIAAQVVSSCSKQFSRVRSEADYQERRQALLRGIEEHDQA